MERDGGGEEIAVGYLEARRQLRQNFWCAASFVSALFETVGS